MNTSTSTSTSIDLGGTRARSRTSLNALPPRTLSVLPRIFIVRHGDTEWSLSSQYTNRTDLPLTQLGKDSARDLGLLLQDVSFDRVLTSPRRRARQTCELVLPGLSPEIEPDLEEWDYGDLEGWLSASIREEQPPDENVFRNFYPHWETPGQVSERADRLITKLHTMAGNIALSTHGHFGRVLAARWIGLPIFRGQHFLLGTASLGILAHEHDHADSPTIALWNVSARDALANPGSFPGVAH